MSHLVYVHVLLLTSAQYVDKDKGEKLIRSIVKRLTLYLAIFFISGFPGKFYLHLHHTVIALNPVCLSISSACQFCGLEREAEIEAWGIPGSFRSLCTCKLCGGLVDHHILAQSFCSDTALEGGLAVPLLAWTLCSLCMRGERSLANIP